MSDLAIRVEGLTKRFDNVTALDWIDLETSDRAANNRNLAQNEPDRAVWAP